MLEFKPEITYGDLLAAMLAIAALLIGSLGFIYSQIIQSDTTRPRIVAWLQEGQVLGLYQGGVEWLLRFLQRFYGSKESLQAYGMSFLLSYLYPFLFFILAYSYFDGTTLFSGEELLPVDSPYRPHFFLGLLLFIGIVTGAFYFFGDRTIKRNSLFIGLIVAILAGSTVVGAVVFSGTVIGAFVFAFLGSAALPRISILIFVVLLVLLHFTTGSSNKSMMLAFFYLMMPLVNALLDWLSWWVSRYFMERAAQERQVWVIVLDIAVDFLAAVAFMLALCLLLPAGAELLDRLYAGHLDVETGLAAQTDWRTYAVLARDEPWGKGIMVTMMLVTTLIPTLLHIFFGVAAFFIHSFKGKELAMYLEATPQGHNGRYALASVWIFGYWVAALAALVALYQGFQHFAQLPIAQWLYSFTGYFFELP